MGYGNPPMSAAISRSRALRAVSGRITARPLLSGGIVVALVVFVWWWWPLTRSRDAIDVVVVGNGAVTQSSDELARRLRQEGMLPLVVSIEAADCAEFATLVDDAARESDADLTDARVVLSLDDWTACAGAVNDDSVDLLVQQPGGPLPDGLSADRGVRWAAPLFGAPVNPDAPGDQPCQWWDTPGAGEDRPGLGKCEADGLVHVLDDDGLTPAGRERFARMVVEAIK